MKNTVAKSLEAVHTHTHGNLENKIIRNKSTNNKKIGILCLYEDPG